MATPLRLNMSHNALRRTATPHLTSVLSLSLSGCLYNRTPAPCFFLIHQSRPKAHKLLIHYHLTVHLTMLFRVLISRRVDTDSLNMYKPVLSLTCLRPLRSAHSLDDENKNKGETGIQLLPSACPSLCFSALFMCISVSILLTTAPPAGQIGSHHQPELKYTIFIRRRCALFLWMSSPSQLYSWCLCFHGFLYSFKPISNSMYVAGY